MTSKATPLIFCMLCIFSCLFSRLLIFFFLKMIFFFFFFFKSFRNTIGVSKGEKVGCFAIIVLQMYCYYKCSVALPHGAVGWSAVCGCGIS